MKIVASNPLQEAEDVGGNMDKQDKPVKESQLPEIIISGRLVEIESESSKDAICVLRNENKSEVHN